MSEQARFSVGQIVHHKILNYRGVIVDVDPNFQSSDLWYELVAISKPPKDMPWYHILVDNEDYITYVAEQNLEEEPNANPIIHPEINYFFSGISNGMYVAKRTKN